MKKDTDLRVIRTQQMIRTAFFVLIDKIGFEKITVQNLVKEAVINRSTFYLHYTDKFDLLDKLEKEILDGLREIILTLDINTIVTASNDDKPFPHIVKILEYVKKNERFYTLILGPNGDPSFINKIGEFIRLMMSEIIIDNGVFDKIKIPVNYLISVVIAVLTSFLNEWLRTGMKETPYELAVIMTMVIRDIPRRLID